MQCYVDSLIEINNNAIELMLRDHFEQSIHVLHDGLQLLHFMQHSQLITNVTKANQIRQLGSEVILHTVELKRCTFDDDDDIIVFFNRALQIDKGFTSMVKTSPAYTEPNPILLGVLLYNLGLAHHILGIRQGHSRYYETALDFYSLSHGSFRGQLYPFDHPNHALHIGILAITNNVGHIHAFFHRAREVQICIDELILRLGQYSSRINYMLDINGEQKVFLINASFYQEISLNAAPAA